MIGAREPPPRVQPAEVATGHRKAENIEHRHESKDRDTSTKEYLSRKRRRCHFFIVPRSHVSRHVDAR